MPLLSRPPIALMSARLRLIALLAVSALTSCDRFKERILGFPSKTTVVPMPVAFDSTSMRRDSISRKMLATQDSVAAMAVVQRATDSLMHGGRPVARTSLPTPVAMPVQSLSRAQILGDSIANAQIEKIAGQNRNVANGDTVRGVVKMDGVGAGSRPILMANGGKTTITLSGLGTEGLRQVLGSDVVVRGLRISPLDIVVSGFSVRAVNGIPTIDGRLIKSSDGWTIELSDKTGFRKLPLVPQALQAFVGSRVWVADEAKNTVPQLYGVIARR